MKSALVILGLATIGDLYLMSADAPASELEAQFQDFVSTYRKP